jgi:hypothetical protein
VLAVINYEEMIWKATMELKWIKEEIVIEGKSFDGKSWVDMTGRYEKILHQRFINSDNGDDRWIKVPTD